MDCYLWTSIMSIVFSFSVRRKGVLECAMMVVRFVIVVSMVVVIFVWSWTLLVNVIVSMVIGTAAMVTLSGPAEVDRNSFRGITDVSIVSIMWN